MGWIGLIALALVGAQGAPALKPTTKWAVAHNEGECILSRGFGPAGGTTFAFKPTPPGLAGDLVLLLPEPGRGIRQGSGDVTLFPSGATFKTEWVNAPLANQDGHGVRLSADDPVFWEALPAATAMTVDAGEREPVRLETGPMAKAWAVLRSCQDNLLRHWGADPAAMAPQPDASRVSNWFSYLDYPDEAIRAGAEGRSVALVTIDSTGVPVSCRTVQKSGHESLDRVTCGVALKRMRFEPVTGGQAQRFYVLPVRWLLPSSLRRSAANKASGG